jgi:ABC-type multidrug transport system ATPase subunit
MAVELASQPSILFLDEPTSYVAKGPWRTGG